METSLFEKLPSGGGWWNVQHTHAFHWMQGPYEICVGNEQKDHEKRVPPLRKTTTSFSDLVTPPPSVSPSSNGVKLERGPKRDNDATLRGTRAFKVMLDALDPCSQLYTKDQENDAIQTMRERMLSFVTGLAQGFFGPKKSRILSLWLSNNRIKEENASILEEFVRFLFEDKATSWNMYLGPRGEWYIKN